LTHAEQSTSLLGESAKAQTKDDCGGDNYLFHIFDGLLFWVNGLKLSQL
jgi:hypothetical protein